MSLLVENPLLALMVIMAVGQLLGRIEIFGFRLGVAAVLFVGLGLAAIEPSISIPPFAYLLGLALFVYTIGLASGREFFANLKSRGLKLMIFAVVIFAIITAATIVLVKIAGLDAPTGAGLFTGALTNTPAMAAVVDSLAILHPNPEDLKGVEQLPLVAYSLAYPLGVLIVILTIAATAKIFRINHKEEAESAGVAGHSLYNKRVLVQRDDLESIYALPERFGLNIIVSRLERDGESRLPGLSAWAQKGDVLTIVGEKEELEKAVELIGSPLSGHPKAGADNLDYRRVFVSNKDLVGIPLEKLEAQLTGMLITRVRRGDVDHVPEPGMTLELGDRVRVVGPHSQMGNISRLFGDSYRRLADFNVFPLAVGMTLGLLVGLIKVPLPGGAALSLGSAGGPLVVALILGNLGRTGKVVWQIPYSANLALRQFGITAFLAAIGTLAGSGFRTALSDPTSLLIIGIGAIITFLISVLVMVIGYKVLKVPFGTIAGALAGIQTHPAVLSYVNDLTKNDLAASGYTATYPVAMITKIMAAQVVLFMLV